MNPTHHVCVRLVGHVSLHELGERFADPLYQALQARGCGDLTGGEAQHDEEGLPQWVTIDVRLVDLDASLEFTRRTLQTLGAPPGSELRYTLEGQSCVRPIDDAPSA